MIQTEIWPLQISWTTPLKKKMFFLTTYNVQKWCINTGNSSLVWQQCEWSYILDLFSFSLSVSCWSCCWRCWRSFTPPGSLWFLHLEKKQQWWDYSRFYSNNEFGIYARCSYMYLHDIFGDIFSEWFDNLALLNSVMLIILFFIILPVFQGSSLQTVSNVNKMPQLVFTLLVTDTLFTVTGDISFSVLCLS